MSVREGVLKVCITTFIQYSGLSQKVDKRIINMTEKLVGEGILNIKETQRALRLYVKTELFEGQPPPPINSRFTIITKHSIFFFFFFSYFIQSRLLLSVDYLTVANLARLAILVQCQVSVRSQYLVRLLSQCWITGGHTIHPPIV